MKKIDYELISELQLSFIQTLLNEDLEPMEVLKFASVLISNYKKAKRILVSKVEVDGDWEKVLELTMEGLSLIVEKVVDLSYSMEDITPALCIQVLSTLSEIQFLDYRDETTFKDDDSSSEEKINLNLYKEFME